MFKLNLAITARTGATLFATVLAGASAWSEGPSAPQFRNGRACWDRLCPVDAPIKSQSSQKSATQAPTASKQAIEKQTPATSAWIPPSSVPIPPQQTPSKATATAFYRSTSRRVPGRRLAGCAAANGPPPQSTTT
jgi:hypothetical protein